MDFETDPFTQLPNELLLKIMIQIPDLASLHSFIEASYDVEVMFEAHAVEITDLIIRASLPLQIQALIRLIIQIRNSEVTRHGLDAFKTISCGTQDGYPIPQSLSIPTPAVLREVLMCAYQIRSLTRSCLCHHLQRCMALRPSHLVDPSFRYGSGDDDQIHPHGRRPEGREYKPQDGGPPSWIEEARVTRAFWWVQMFYDLKNAGIQSRLGWSKQNYERLENMQQAAHLCMQPAAQLCVSSNPDPEQIKTITEYINELQMGASSTPATKSDFSFSKSSAMVFRLPWPIQELNVEWPTPEPPDDSERKWKQNSSCLKDEAPGYVFASRNSRKSPLRYLGFKPFRPYGFAIWDLKRMHGLGFLDGPPKLDGPFHLLLMNPFRLSAMKDHSEKYFTWRSILSDEELRVEEERRANKSGLARISPWHNCW